MSLRRCEGKLWSRIGTALVVGVLGWLCLSSVASAYEASLLHLPVLNWYSAAGQFSSRDRTGGNMDWSDEAAGRRGFLYRDAHGDRVLAEVLGNGELNRFWFTGLQGAGHIRIYVDDDAFPAYEMPIRELFAGSNPPFVGPHVYDDDASSGGFVSYVQLPFKRYLKVATTGEPSYYHVGYQMHGEETPTASQWLVSAPGDPFTEVGQITLGPESDSVIATFSGPAVLTRLTLRLPDGLVKPAFQRSVVTDHGRAFTGFSEFTVRIDPDNAGVRLVRRLDYSIGDQTGNVYVDGTLVGEWSTPGTAEAFNWRDAVFDIPGEFTAGKESLRLRIEFVHSVIDWNEFYYWVYIHPIQASDQVTPADHPHGEGLLLTDTLDVGDVVSEMAHGYRIEGAQWSGHRDWVYPPPSDPDADQLAKTLDILRNMWLSITWDDHSEPAVMAPLSLFFATPIGPHPIDSALVRVVQTSVGAEFTALLPMPFTDRADLRLHHLGPQSVELAYEIEGIAHSDLPDLFDRGEVGYLHATYRREHPTRTGHDYTLLSTDGVGKVVGVTMRLGGPASRGYLEGDERIRVDGRMTPSIYGTGTEDHFGGGWYFNRGPFALPLYGAPGHAVFEGKDQTSLYRFFITDPIPFRSGIQYTMEHGGTNELVTDYESVVFWYGLPRIAAYVTDRVELGPSIQDALAPVHIEGNSRRVRLISSFEGPLESERMPQTVVYHEGRLTLPVRIDWQNVGVILRRVLDQRVGPQRATVWVDGVKAGIWYHPESNLRHRFADSDFYIPPRLTQGKDRLVIEIVPEGEWNAVRYEALSQVVPFEPHFHPVAIEALHAEEDGEMISLSWQIAPSQEPDEYADITDELRYRIYRGTTPDFVPQPWLLVGETDAQSWDEARRLDPGTYAYRVQAVDGLGRIHSLSDTVSVQVAAALRIEGEDLANVRTVGGAFQRQGMDWVGPQWSGGHHLFFQGGDVGGSIAGEFYIDEDGSYEVAIYYTLAPDYGIVQVLLDGAPVGGPVDGYAPNVRRAGPHPVGTVPLTAGYHTLELRVVGQNPLAHGYFAGLDLLELTRVGE